MRNVLKATTLENRFPLLAVEEGCILSKDADITVAFRVDLPELYTVTSAEYAASHSAWVKAIKVLPTYSVVHKQDWFVKEGYHPDLQKEDMSPLPQFRATLQRATLPESRLLPVPDQDDQEPQPATEQLLHPLPGTYHPQGGTGQGYRPQVSRSNRAVRADYERVRFYSSLSPEG